MWHRLGLRLLGLLPTVPILLAHLAGAVVAVALLTRRDRRNTPAVLVLVGFALLFLGDLAK